MRGLSSSDACACHASASCSATENNDTAYTSVSVALFQMVPMAPAHRPQITPSAHLPLTRATSAAAMAQAPAVASAESSVPACTGESPGTRRQSALPSATYSGVPGGCGIPSVPMAVANSLASQKVSDGAAVQT